MRRIPNEVTPARLRRAVASAVLDRLALSPSSPADPEALARFARRDGVTPEAAARLRTLLATLEHEAYSGTPATAGDRVHDAWRIFADVDREARYHGRRARTVAAPLLIAATLLAPAVAALRAATAMSPAAEAFTRGVDDYELGRFGDAVRAFEDAAARAPRAADAWANLGTAAWAAGDTARAVQGWERALSLEPAADDARDRMGLTPAASGLVWRVPPLSPDAVLLIGALLWVAGWGWAAYRLARRRRAGGTAMIAVAVAALMLALVRPLDAHLVARDRVVIQLETPVRGAPRLSADRTTVARTGEVARVLARDGVWARIALDDARGGWVPVDALLSLTRD